ncbi:MAG: TadG family pilus assembly protein [Xanthobacteraceae bacterium]
MRYFLTDTGGNVVMMAALLFPALLGIGALAVDVSDFYVVKSHLQATADSAALTAAYSLPDTDKSRTNALNLANANVSAADGTVTSSGDIVFGVYDRDAKTFTPTTIRPNAVQVTAARNSAHNNAAPTFLARIWGVESVDIAASSIAVGLGPNACVIALAPSGSETFKVSGSGSVDVPNCAIWVNSSSSSALSQSGGGGYIKARSINVVGGYSSGNYTPLPTTSQKVIADPLIEVPEPSPPSGCTYQNTTFNNPISFSDGTTFCGNIKFNANVNFNSGLHYFKGARVTTASNIHIVSQNAMLYFDSTSTWDSSGTGDIQLTAPQIGTYKGIAIFGSRSGGGSIFSLTGNNNYQVNGTIYLPKANLKLTGNADLSVSAKSGYVIAWTFSYQGNSSFNFDAYGGAVPSQFARGTTLVK